MNNRITSADGETAVLLIHEHWTRFLPPTFLILLSWVIYALCGILAAFVTTQNHALSLWFLVGGHVILLLFHHTAFYRYLSISTHQFLLTNRRILGSEQSLWLSDDTLDIPLYRIRSIEAKKEGILQHILGYGTLVLNRGELPSLRSIPHPDAVHDRIAEQLQRILPAASRNREVTRTSPLVREGVP